MSLVLQTGTDRSLLHAVNLVRRGGNARRGVPIQVVLWLLLDRVALRVEFLFRRRLILTLLLHLLLKSTLKSVAVAEVPGTFALRLVVGKAALEVDSVGVDPLAGGDLASLPLSTHLHSSLLEDVGAVALLLAVLPPSGVDVTVLVGEHAFAVATAVLPVTMVLTDSAVCHLADATLLVLFPATVVLVALRLVTVDTRSGADTINEVTLIDVAVIVEGSTGAGVTTRRSLHLIVLGTELINGSLFLCHTSGSLLKF